MKYLILTFWGGCLLSASLFAQTNLWPKEIPLKSGGKITIYQPQPDELSGNLLKGHAAISANEKATDQPVYGAVFFEAQLITDKATRTGTLEKITVTNAKINGVEDETKIEKLAALLETEVPKWELDISLDQLVATMKRNSGDGIMYNNTPPKIYFRQKPSSLIILDGEPKVQKDKDLDAERVINSPNLIFKEGSQWNMYNGGTWYKSSGITTGWTAEKSMSKKVTSINDQIKKQEKEANNGKAPTEKPVITDIIVSTEPAELIQTEGEPVYKPIDSTTLQYASNTKNDILKTADGQLFILVAGRWYKSSSLNGPWTFNGSDKLPPEFSKIPEGSPKDNVLVSVSGTRAADEAIIDAEIPQTAKVDRKTAKAEVEYDGNPKFENITGTTLQLAENANLTVLKEASGKYFLLDNGIWFVGNGAKGPWTVSETRPDGIDLIPASSSAYNAKYVYIYEVTPTYIVTGYTSGYLGTFVQGDPTIIFGTGFYYQPWYGSVFYPRPATWGFNFSYNPWTGWTMSYGFNIGFLHVGFGFGGGYGGAGWFGPPYYRPPFRPPYYGGGYYGNNRPGGGNNININTGGGDINIGGNHNNIYNRPGNNNNGNNRPGVASRPDRKSGNTGGANYKAGGNNSKPTVGTGNKPAVGTGNKPAVANQNQGKPGQSDRQVAKPATSKPNNVFADKDGNVFQKDSKGDIKERDNKSNTWKPANNSQQSRDIKPDVQARDRSTQKSTQVNNMKKPAPPKAKPQAKPSSGTRPAGPKPAARPAVKR